jgi:hypothetical protein
MATPNDSPGTDQNDIQFEQAEFTAENDADQQHATRCTACTATIPDVYYEAGGKVVCAPCRDQIEAMFHQGSRLGRGIKAIVFGTIAAALGAILYYAIVRITGLNIGLVAVVVGLLVGGAVKAASGNRGGSVLSTPRRIPDLFGHCRHVRSRHVRRTQEARPWLPGTRRSRSCPVVRASTR